MYLLVLNWGKPVSLSVKASFKHFEYCLFGRGSTFATVKDFESHNYISFSKYFLLLENLFAIVWEGFLISPSSKWKCHEPVVLTLLGFKEQELVPRNYWNLFYQDMGQGLFRTICFILVWHFLGFNAFYCSSVLLCHVLFSHWICFRKTNKMY